MCILGAREKVSKEILHVKVDLQGPRAWAEIVACPWESVEIHAPGFLCRSLHRSVDLPKGRLQEGNPNFPFCF